MRPASPVGQGLPPLRDERDRRRADRIADAYLALSGRDLARGPERLFEYGGPERLLRD